jgi:hypothetical protein
VQSWLITFGETLSPRSEVYEDIETCFLRVRYDIEEESLRQQEEMEEEQRVLARREAFNVARGYRPGHGEVAAVLNDNMLGQHGGVALAAIGQFVPLYNGETPERVANGHDDDEHEDDDDVQPSPAPVPANGQLALANGQPAHEGHEQLDDHPSPAGLAIVAEHVDDDYDDLLD